MKCVNLKITLDVIKLSYVHNIIINLQQIITCHIFSHCHNSMPIGECAMFLEVQ